MSKERYEAIMWHETEELTKEDIANGWHFCYEFDGCLMNRNELIGICECFEEDDERRNEVEGRG